METHDHWLIIILGDTKRSRRKEGSTHFALQDVYLQDELAEPRWAPGIARDEAHLATVVGVAPSESALRLGLLSCVQCRVVSVPVFVVCPGQIQTRVHSACAAAVRRSCIR